MSFWASWGSTKHPVYSSGGTVAIPSVETVTIYVEHLRFVIPLLDAGWNEDGFLRSNEPRESAIVGIAAVRDEEIYFKGGIVTLDANAHLCGRFDVRELMDLAPGKYLMLEPAAPLSIDDRISLWSDRPVTIRLKAISKGRVQ